MQSRGSAQGLGRLPSNGCSEAWLSSPAHSMRNSLLSPLRGLWSSWELHLGLAPTLLYISLGNSIACFESEDKVASALESDPECFGSWESISFASQKAAKLGNHDEDFLEDRRARGRFFLLSHQIPRLPLFGSENRLTGDLRHRSA